MKFLKSQITWIPVDLALPEIPKGRHAVHVLVNAHDPCYEECCPGHGSAVESAMFMKSPDMSEPWFHCMLLSMNRHETSKFAGWAPHHDEITHWAYWPEAIQKGEDE